MRKNAQVLCDICANNGIAVAGIIKFSDGDLQVAKAYQEGGCAQLGVSRAKHLQALKEAETEFWQHVQEDTEPGLILPEI